MDPLALAIEPLIPGLRRYARAWTRDAASADDLVQDSLERAVASWGGRRKSDVRPWLYAILHNRLVDYSRQLARRATLVAIDAADDAALARPPEQEAALFERDMLRAIGALPDDQRAVLLLVSVEDLPYVEVAAVLGVPIGTVMSRLSRARDRLSALLTAGERPRLRRVK